MDDFASFRRINGSRYLYVSTLSKETLGDVGASNLGDDSGYFIYEVDERRGIGGIDVLAKAASFDAALRLLDVFEESLRRVADVTERRALRRSRSGSALKPLQHA
jgi:hypothetical protein